MPRKIDIEFEKKQRELLRALENKDLKKIRELYAEGITVNDIDLLDYVTEFIPDEGDKKEIAKAIRRAKQRIDEKTAFLALLGLRSDYVFPPWSRAAGRTFESCAKGTDRTVLVTRHVGSNIIYIRPERDKPVDRNDRGQSAIFVPDVNGPEVKNFLQNFNGNKRFVIEGTLDYSNQPEYNRLPDHIDVYGSLILGPSFTELPNHLGVMNTLDISQTMIREIPSDVSVISGGIYLPEDFPIQDPTVVAKQIKGFVARYRIHYVPRGQKPKYVEGV